MTILLVFLVFRWYNKGTDISRRPHEAETQSLFLLWLCLDNDLMHDSRDYNPLYERVSDYLFTMSALTRGEARRQWRQSIKDAWNNRCAYCGNPPIADESLTIDHVRPKSCGGEDRTSNVIPACLECNQDKSSQEWVAWFRMQPFYTIESEWRIRQWLSGGLDSFGPYDEEDSKIVEEYANRLMGTWPTD